MNDKQRLDEWVWASWKSGDLHSLSNEWGLFEILGFLPILVHNMYKCLRDERLIPTSTISLLVHQVWHTSWKGWNKNRFCSKYLLKIYYLKCYFICVIPSKRQITYLLGLFTLAWILHTVWGYLNQHLFRVKSLQKFISSGDMYKRVQWRLHSSKFSLFSLFFISF